MEVCPEQLGVCLIISLQAEMCRFADVQTLHLQEMDLCMHKVISLQALQCASTSTSLGISAHSFLVDLLTVVCCAAMSPVRTSCLAKGAG
jgi:hypothetical protein